MVIQTDSEYKHNKSMDKCQYMSCCNHEGGLLTHSWLNGDECVGKKKKEIKKIMRVEFALWKEKKWNDRKMLKGKENKFGREPLAVGLEA